jgi:organic hydroperoxide reductase OsmC/OhrA
MPSYQVSGYVATVQWSREGGSFLDNKYSREHQWIFDGGATVAASSSPHVVPTPYSNPAAVDPEEALIAALASCHMLSFLYLAGRQGFVVDEYRDEATGRMTRNANGKYWLSEVVLHPRILFSGDKTPDQPEIAALHHAAHEECYIANSVKTDVRVE